MATIYATLINQYKFKYQTVFSARFDKQDADDQVLDDIELYINLNNIRKLTQFDINSIIIRLQLEHQIINPQTKDYGGRFDKTNSMTI